MSLSYILLYLNFGLLLCSFVAMFIFMHKRSNTSKKPSDELELNPEDLPPGVFILPPGAKDPSSKKRKLY